MRVESFRGDALGSEFAIALRQREVEEREWRWSRRILRLETLQHHHSSLPLSLFITAISLCADRFSKRCKQLVTFPGSGINTRCPMRCNASPPEFYQQDVVAEKDVVEDTVQVCAKTVFFLDKRVEIFFSTIESRVSHPSGRNTALLPPHLLPPQHSKAKHRLYGALLRALYNHRVLAL